MTDAIGQKLADLKAFCRVSGCDQTKPDSSLLSDAEAGEDPAQQVIRRELTRDLRERLLRLPQLFRHQFAGALLEELPPRFLQMAIGARECVEMPTSG